MAESFSTEDLVILVHGGGNIIGYPQLDEHRFKILRHFAGFKIVVFPQSICLKDYPNHIKNTVRHYCCNANLTIILRDLQSYSLAKQMFNGTTRLLLAPDMAFQVNQMCLFYLITRCLSVFYH